jgi:ribosome-associated translation inhibitor RaiA
MNKEVLFRDFEGLLHHYQFIDMQIRKTIGKFEGIRPSHVRVTIDEVARKAFRGHDFGCEIIVHHPNMRKTILTHKFSKDFYKSVRAACDAAEKVLRRNSKSKLARRRKLDSITSEETRFQI